MSSGPHRRAPSSRPGRVAQRGDDRRGRHDRRRLADALHAVGRVRLRLLDELGHDRRHVERRRDQVVREARVRDHAVARQDLLHHREAEPLRRAALDLALDRLPVHRLADVLRRADPHDARQSEVDVHLDDRLHRRARERDVRRGVRRSAPSRDRAPSSADGGRCARRRPRRRPCARAPQAPRGTRRVRRRRPSTSSATPKPSPTSRRARSRPARARTRSVPSSRHATWRITFVTPWPTSAAAQWTSAEPSPNSRTRAAQKSSKPSE